MFDIPDFYPTPKHCITKMLEGVKLGQVKTILEPSAGKGDIVDYIVDYVKTNEHRFRYHEFDVDTIEINENLRHILKGKGYRVVHDDFLTFQTYKQYDLIIMNPPFSDGDKHLLKALEMQKYGGQVVCLLNAETLRNPYTNTRKDLVRRLEDLGAEIEYIEGVFADAERKTDVEVALIKVNIPRADRRSIILNGLRRQEQFQQKINPETAVAEADILKAIVAQYNFEMRAGLNLLNEYLAMKPYILKSVKDGYGNEPVIKIKVGDVENEHQLWNAYIEAIRYKYWQALANLDVIDQLFTTKLRHEYYEKIQDLKNYDFSLFNIYAIKAELNKVISKSIEDTILELFDEFSHKHYWYDETSKNIHYYNGWKTNKAWKINKRVIIPLCAFDDWNGKFRPVYQVKDKLMDIEKVFNYLDGGRTTEHVDLLETLKRAEEECQTKKIQLKYFTVTFYKKGTCHIEFTDLDLLKKFNIFGSQRKGWLPPSYGKTKYEDMNSEEQAVINEFEGKAEYEKTIAQKDYFICESVGLPMIEGKTVA